ncbi:MAG: SMP-30/gluconolactonase/LRE family protein [Pseudomonadota bacterium]
MTERVAAGAVSCVAETAALLGEGPLWDPRCERLLFLDIKSNRVFRHDPATGRTENFDMTGAVSALGLAQAGGYVCAYRDGFAFLDLDGASPALSPITNPESDKPGNRFNDGKVDPAGGFWAGTMDDAEKAVSGAWWRLAPDGSATMLNDNVMVTNGPAFDPERGLVYMTDSARQVIFRAKTDGTDMEDKAPFMTFAAENGYPDGMEVDCEGCLWVAFWDGGAVRRFSREGGLMEEIPIPAQRPTSLTIVEDRLFVTSAKIGLDADALAAFPLSGGLFSVALSKPLQRKSAFLFDDSALRKR